eukprot:10378843-Ditylum_brightwellii.AAC.1
MRAADERPPAKPPWATTTSTAQPLPSHPLNHTPTITDNEENQTKRHASTALPPKLHSSIHHPKTQIIQYKPTYAHPSELQQKTQAHTSHLLITFWHLLMLQSGQKGGSALAPITAATPTDTPMQRLTTPCSTKRTAAAQFQQRLLCKRQSSPKAHLIFPIPSSLTSSSTTSKPITIDLQPPRLQGTFLATASSPPITHNAG